MDRMDDNDLFVIIDYDKTTNDMLVIFPRIQIINNALALGQDKLTEVYNKCGHPYPNYCKCKTESEAREHYKNSFISGNYKYKTKIMKFQPDKYYYYLSHMKLSEIKDSDYYPYFNAMSYVREIP